MSQPNKQLSLNELLQIVEQMSLSDLDEFINQVKAIKFRRSKQQYGNESALLEKINNWIEPDLPLRIEELIAKRRGEGLTTEEQNELTTLGNRQQAAHEARVEALSELAQRRGVTLTQVMNQLGVRFPDYL